MDFLKALPVLLLLWASCESHPLSSKLSERILQHLAEEKPKVSAEDDKINYRLPTNVVPESYNIVLDPFDFDKESNNNFNGDVEIVVKTVEDTNTITFHAKNMEFNSIEVFDTKTNKPLEKPTESADKKTDFYTLTFKTKLAKNSNYKLILKYKGLYTTDMRGFYKSNYTDDAGKLRSLVTTHFEPVGARQAFPCWDEPAIKATFTISIKHPSTYHAISNMPPIKDSTKELTKFEPTLKMSTYLVAFVVSDYDKKSHKDDKTFTVLTRVNAIDRVDYALDIGLTELKKLEEYTGIKYQFPKMDQISIPHFSAGAMENWGLVTYKESALLYKDGVTTTASKQSIASIIAHEFAHQWFGNYVSPKWWTYLWLNEGFATYFEHLIPQLVDKNWRMMEQFVVKSMQKKAFVKDAEVNTRPMNHEVGSQSEIKNLFDTISYQKAGSVIRMMSHILTEEVFQKGLNTYLTAKKLDSATSDDLFENLQKEADKSKIKITDDKNIKLKDIMNSWVTAKGYPVVNVELDQAKKTATITQQRFIIDPVVKDEETKYWVPINYVLQSNINFTGTKPTDWLKPKDKSLILNLEEKDSKDNKDLWIILNKQQTGYYRVNYDKKNWELLINQLKKKHTEIDPLNRAQLIDDALSLAISEQLDYNIALDLTMYLDKEIDYIPWVAAISHFSNIDKVLKNKPIYGKFQQFMNRQLNRAMKEVGYEGDADHLSKLMRSELMQWSCYYGLESCQKYAEQEFNNWLAKPKEHKLNPDTKQTVLCTALRKVDLKTWEKVLKIYKDSKDNEEKSSLLSALGCPNSPEILQKFINLALNETEPLESVEKIFNVIYSNSHNGVDTVLDFIQDNLKLIKEQLKDKRMITSILSSVGKIINNEDQFYKITMIIVDLGGSEEENHTRLNNAMNSIQISRKQAPKISEWLDSQNFEASTDDEDNSGTAATLTFSLMIAAFFMTRIY